MRQAGARVAATSVWVDPDGFRAPAGEVHAWVPGHNQTLCGLSLSRSRLVRLPHVEWADALPETGRDADEVQVVCPRCLAATGAKRGRRSWTRRDPRP
jgi:hypothetical protein